MNVEQAREAIEKCIKVADSLDEYMYLEMTKYDGNWGVGLRAHHREHTKHQVIAACTPLVGKLTLDEDIFWFRGEKDGLSVEVVTEKPCKILGYKIEKRPVLKQVETGDFEDFKVAISDCDIKSGKFSEADIEVTI